MIFTRISLSFLRFTNSVSGILPASYNSTHVSIARNIVSTSENPYRPQILPPIVAQFRNCTPTIWRRLSLTAPCVYSFSLLFISSSLNGVMQPITNSSSVSCTVSNPRPERSIAVEILRFPIFSQTIPPRTSAVFF